MIKFKFKYNPLDISSIFLCDEKKKQYVEIHNADPEFGHISEEEYNYLRKVLKRNEFPLDTATIMEARENLADLITGTRKEKRMLLRGQEKAGGRARDLAGHPKVSIERNEQGKEESQEPWVPKDFDVELPS